MTTEDENSQTIEVFIPVGLDNDHVLNGFSSAEKTMKKIILLISIIVSLSATKATAQIDTLAGLQNIVNNKASYVGQSFSVLLAQMPISIKYFEPSRGLPYKKIAIIKDITLELRFLSEARASR